MIILGIDSIAIVGYGIIKCEAILISHLNMAKDGL